MIKKVLRSVDWPVILVLSIVSMSLIGGFIGEKITSTQNGIDGGMLIGFIVGFGIFVVLGSIRDS